MPLYPPAGAGSGIPDQGTATFLDWTVAAAPATPASGKVRTYAKTGKQFGQKDDTGLETLFGAGGTGGGAAGGILGQAVDTSGTRSITSATLADIPTASIEVTFTAPPSGVVDVLLEATVGATSTALAYQTWGIREGSSIIAGAIGDSIAVRNSNSTGAVEQFMGASKRFHFTGLTPGASYTYKWAAACSTSGGSLVATTNSPAIMTVLDPTVGLGAGGPVESAAIYAASASGTGTTTAPLTLGTVIHDDSTYSATADKLTIPTGKGGVFLVGVSARATSNGDLTAVLGLRVNGTQVAATNVLAHWVAAGNGTSRIISLADGDVLDLSFNADSGFGIADVTLWLIRLSTPVGAGTPAGTTFPAGPTTNDRFYRTDRGLEYYYDGTRWLTTEIFEETALANNISTGIDTGHWSPKVASASDLWLVDARFVYQVTAPHSGTQYWSAELHKYDNTTNATILTLTTDQSTTTWNAPTATAIGALLGSANTLMYWHIIKTSTPGNVYMGLAFRYRLVG